MTFYLRAREIITPVFFSHFQILNIMLNEAIINAFNLYLIDVRM